MAKTVLLAAIGDSLCKLTAGGTHTGLPGRRRRGPGGHHRGHL